MRRVVGAWLVLSLVALALAGLGPLVARRFAHPVTLVAKASDVEVAANRELFLPGDEVAAIYGIPAARPVTVVAWDETQILRPAEDPTLRLLLVDKQRGDNPLQLKTVDFFARWLALGAAGSAALAMLVRWRQRRRGPAPALATPVPS